MPFEFNRVSRQSEMKPMKGISVDEEKNFQRVDSNISRKTIADGREFGRKKENLVYGQRGYLSVNNMKNEQVARISTNLEKNQMQTGKETTVSFSGSMVQAGWFSSKVEAATLQLGK